MHDLKNATPDAHLKIKKMQDLKSATLDAHLKIK